MILPSFTEGYPMVVLEALSRLRPVIIFTEIEHIIEGRNGIFAHILEETRDANASVERAVRDGFIRGAVRGNP